VGINLNRIIKKYDSFAGSEEYFANQISLEIEKNDMVIDIHSSRNEDDKPCVFLDYENEGNISLSDATTIKFILKGYPAAFNKNGKYENYCTQSYADSQGKNCILIECGYHNHQSTYDLAFENIINILAKLGMIKAQAKDVEKTYILIEKMFIKQKKAEFTKKYKHLDKINKGETITIFEDGEKIVVPKDGYIILPNATAKIGDEWFELGFEE
jgi:predicted deacylase